MDLFLLQKINQLVGRNIYLDNLAIFLAQYLGYILVLILFFILLIDWRKNWRPVFFSFLSAVLARFALVEIIRFLWFRPRPFLVVEVQLLIDKNNQASFPSGHAAFYFALSFFLFLFLRKTYPHSKFWQIIGICFLISAILISLARIFVGLHWPSDILVGIFLGIFVACLVDYLVDKFSKK